MTSSDRGHPPCSCFLGVVQFHSLIIQSMYGCWCPVFELDGPG
jgi:hypothetical protein